MDNFSVVIFLILSIVTLITIVSFNEHTRFLFNIYLCCLVYFLTYHIIGMYLCYELVIIPIVALIISKGWYSERLYACLVIVSYTLLFSLPSLAIILMLNNSWIRNLLMISLSNFANYWFILIFIVKLPIWGLHYWLPLAHVEAPTEGSILLAGLLLKLGGYGFIKILISWFPVGCVYFVPLISAMAIFSIILSSFNAIVQSDFKRLIAYTSISHMNFVVLGIFSHSIYGLVGGTVLMYAHGLVSSGLFAVVGMLYERYFSRQIEYYSGLIVGMPILGSLFFIILLGNFGFPLTLNFIGEFLILVGLAHFNLYLLFLSSIGLFLSVVYSILLYNKLMFGNLKPFIRQIKDVTLFEFTCLISLSWYIIFFGIWPMSVLDCIYLGLSHCIVK